MGKRTSSSTETSEEKGRLHSRAGDAVKLDDSCPKPTEAFKRYQQAVPEQRVQRMLEGGSVFSQHSPLRAWVVIWLMIFQRLHPKGTQAVAVREMLLGPVSAFV